MITQVKAHKQSQLQLKSVSQPSWDQVNILEKKKKKSENGTDSCGGRKSDALSIRAIVEVVYEMSLVDKDV